MPGVSLRPREEVLASYTVVKGYHAYGWPIDDERGVYFVQPDVVCLDSDGEQLGLKRKFLNGDEKGSLSDFLLPDLSTALIAIDSTARGAGVKPEVQRTDSIGEFGAYQRVIDPEENRFATHYPGLEGYLVMRLRELGEVKISPSRTLSIIADLEFNPLPTVLNTECERSRLEGGIWINSDAGGCSVGNASFRKLPIPGKAECSFDFDLSLDSLWVKPEMHSPEYLMDRIDEFVRMAKIGFCYSFSGSYVDPSIRTKR